MRILLLLLTSMFLYSCSNKNSTTDNDHYDLKTPCGCVSSLYMILFEMDELPSGKEAPVPTIQRYRELADKYEIVSDVCGKVIAVFEIDEIKTMTDADTILRYRNSLGHGSYYIIDAPQIEEAIMKTDDFDGCKEYAIEVQFEIKRYMEYALNDDF